MRYCVHALLQDLALRRLWVPEVHHLVQELIDDHKVVSYRLFFEFLEIFHEDLR